MLNQDSQESFLNTNIAFSSIGVSVSKQTSELGIVWLNVCSCRVQFIKTDHGLQPPQLPHQTITNLSNNELYFTKYQEFAVIVQAETLIPQTVIFFAHKPLIFSVALVQQAVWKSMKKTSLSVYPEILSIESS